MSLLEHILNSEEYKVVLLIESFWYEDHMIEIFDIDSLALK